MWVEQGVTCYVDSCGGDSARTWQPETQTETRSASPADKSQPPPLTATFDQLQPQLELRCRNGIWQMAHYRHEGDGKLGEAKV